MKRYYGQVSPDRNGYIDVYAAKEDVRIAIEYDNRLWAGWKSLQKLLQSNANICIEIISGPKDISKKSIGECLEDNIKRIIIVFNETIAYYTEINDMEKISHLKKKKIILAVINLDFFDIHIASKPRERHIPRHRDYSVTLLFYNPLIHKKHP